MNASKYNGETESECDNKVQNEVESNHNKINATYHQHEYENI